MSIWDTYTSRINVHGGSKRGAAKTREVHTLETKLVDSLSYHTVRVFDKQHGYNITDHRIFEGSFEQNVAIINSDNLNEKYIYSLPGEDIACGDLIEWMGNHWIVNEKDANTTLYTRAKLLQCNYLLKWIDNDKNIIEQWCTVEDGTKLLLIVSVWGNPYVKYLLNCWNIFRVKLTTA
ncbi:MAG: hypothetical protein MJ236_02525 [Clostridia bacterium]|nr:hypothetical protein [Clostridia bacterium]